MPSLAPNESFHELFPAQPIAHHERIKRALMIFNLLEIVWNALKSLVEFLTVLLLGLTAALLIILPWLLRVLALIGWLTGTFLIWRTVNNVYDAFTPALPLLALSMVPAILSAALVVGLFSHGQQGKLWGAMTLWGVVGWMVQKGLMLLMTWHYGVLVVQVLPATLSAVLLLTILLRWGPIIRARRFRQAEPVGLKTEGKV